MWVGGPNYEEPDEAARRFFASDVILASKLRALFGAETPIYCVNAAEGGTFMVSKPGSRDWQKASNECFSRGVDNMYLPAIAKIQAAHPTRVIYPIVLFQGGESEAITGGADLANFPAALQTFYNDMNAAHSTLARAPWIFTKIHYNITANETIINNPHSNLCK